MSATHTVHASRRAAKRVATLLLCCLSLRAPEPQYIGVREKGNRDNKRETQQKRIGESVFPVGELDPPIPRDHAFEAYCAQLL